MAISDKTRKILWGLSGNRCGFCQQRLVIDQTDTDPESVVGDEAHLVSKSPDGPRGHVQLACDHDAYENLILLCKTHHKMVDDQPETYTFEFLIFLKCLHEVWVDQQLSTSQPKTTGNYLARIRYGKDLTFLFQGSLSFFAHA
ncbi:MAG TPA: hypothetical protein VK658_23045 [Chryseolinea sp.]|nr:hypothetical protein [Chryseolinea sp.]